jgi:hypothetical protein
LHEEVELKSINSSDSENEDSMKETILNITPNSIDPSPGAAIIDRIFGSFENIFGMHGIS